MKAVALFMASFLPIGCFSVTSESSYIKTKKEEINLGRIAVQDTISKQLSIYNHGPGYLIIEDVKSGCGSRILRWETKPIAPAATGTIDLLVLSGERTGAFSQTIVARTNAREIFKTFQLSGDVIYQGK